jgi:DNA-binding response OmpR family regulator
MTATNNITEGDQQTRELQLLRDAIISRLDGVSGLKAFNALVQLDTSELEVLLHFFRSAVANSQPVQSESAGADTKSTVTHQLRVITGAADARTGPAATIGGVKLRIGEIELDPIRRVVVKNRRRIRLSPTEFDLLHYLMARSGIPVRHAELLRKIWGLEYGQELEYLRTYIHQLRKKLEDIPSVPRYLLTEPCYGYRFVEAAS